MQKTTKKSNRKPQKPNSGFAINVLTLIVIGLLVFEGKSLMSLFSSVGVEERIKNEVLEVFKSQNLLETETESPKVADPPKEQTEATQKQTEPQTESPPVDIPTSTSVVPAQSVSVDDSYFADAAFIGDSRMEGFRNQSGITQGTFYTAVGMELESLDSTPYIATAKGNITVYDALKKQKFNKIYMMIGTNELGIYDFEEFKTNYANVMKNITAIQPDATIYIFSVIYVEDTLTEFDYVNNANVQIANEKILQMCEAQNYHYINLNEILSTGNHSLIPGASADGVHLEASYLEMWLDYTKSHYIPDTAAAGTQTSETTATETPQTTSTTE